MTSSLLVLLLLSHAERPATAMPSPPTAGRWRYLTRLEATGLALLPGGSVGEVESYAQLTPMLVVGGGEALGLNLGAPVRLRLAGGEPGAGLVRREDWDSLSDWGQLVHALKIGSDTSPVGLWVGALEGYSLLSGHLVRRYSNRANPDYHPAGASLTGTLGPLYVEAFASDVLGARLMGAQAEVDFQHLFTGPPRQRGRYTLGLSAVHDWGRAGGVSPPVTLAHLDAGRSHYNPLKQLGCTRQGPTAKVGHHARPDSQGRLAVDVLRLVEGQTHGALPQALAPRHSRHRYLWLHLRSR